MEGKKDKEGQNPTMILEAVPQIIDLENPKSIIGIQSLRTDNEGFAQKMQDLISEDYHPEKILILLGMSMKFAQTNFHKVEIIFVKRS